MHPRTISITAWICIVLFAACLGSAPGLNSYTVYGLNMFASVACMVGSGYFMVVGGGR